MDKLVSIHGSAEEVLETLREGHGFPESALEWLGETLATPVKSRLPPLPRDARPMVLPALQATYDFLDE